MSVLAKIAANHSKHIRRNHEESNKILRESKLPSQGSCKIDKITINILCQWKNIFKIQKKMYFRYPYLLKSPDPEREKKLSNHS